MKTIKYLLFVSCFFTACKKDNKEGSLLVGQWQWIRTDVIYSGNPSTPQSTSKTWQINFNDDHSFDQTGDLYGPANGSYQLSRSYDLDFVTIDLSDSTMQHYYDFINSDTLHLGSGPVADGIQHYFVKTH